MPDETPAANPAEDRINSLIAQRDESAERISQQEQQIKNLSTQLAVLSDTLLKKPEPTPSPTPKESSGSPSSDQVDIASLVKSAVNEALAPIQQQAEENKRSQDLRAKQAASYEKAVTLFPDLEDPSSPIAKTVNQIAAGRPDLASLEDAPVVLANLARGLIVDSKSAAVEQNVRKQDARVTRPSPASNRVVTTPPGGDRAAEARQVVESAIEHGQKGNGSAMFADMFRAELTGTAAKLQSE